MARAIRFAAAAPPLVLGLAVVAWGAVRAADAPAAPIPGAGPAVVNSVGMRLVPVPAGTFTMGSPPGAPSRQDEETTRGVTLTRPFRVSATEVTRAQWLAVMGRVPAAPQPADADGELPVTSVSWNDAQAFCRALSEKENASYRLPTEAEWEYACRAGASESRAPSPGAGSLDAVAWHAGNSEASARPVARRQANPWGLFDLLGNAAEWTQDAYAPYPSADATDPVVLTGGAGRVVRGGSWRSFPPALRCAARTGVPAAYQLPHLGFRVVQELPPGTTSAASPSPATLRVMSFNIRYDNPQDGEDAWPRRKAKAASMVRFHGADLAGLQEALRHQIADLEAALPGYGWFGTGRSAQRDGEHCAVLYRRDRLELLEQGTFWLSETPDEAGSRSWDSALPRIVTWARLRDRRDGTRFHFFNTHFDHRGETARRESARLLLRQVAAIAGAEGPVVVTGDFNAGPDSEPYRLLTSGPGALVDALPASSCPHHGPASTWNGFRAIEPGRRIDFVLFRPPVEVLQHGALSDTFDGRFPSDHLPVLAEIALKGGAARACEGAK